MTTGRTNKARTRRGLLAAVISSPLDLTQAIELKNPPDLFELRLDALYPVLPEVAPRFAELRAPFIITARHPAEGGAHRLLLEIRRDLLLRFLPQADYVDVELRSANQLQPVLELAKRRKIKRIISVHELQKTPNARELVRYARAAERFAPDIVKIVTRVDRPEELTRLAHFFRHEKTRAQLSVMGLGRFGQSSRIAFAREGSALNYVHLGTPRLEGQLSLEEMRDVFASLPRG